MFVTSFTQVQILLLLIARDFARSSMTKTKVNHLHSAQYYIPSEPEPSKSFDEAVKACLKSDTRIATIKNKVVQDYIKRRIAEKFCEYKHAAFVFECKQAKANQRGKDLEILSSLVKTMQ